MWKMNELVDIRISKVKIFGENVDTVDVDFKEGLNLVSGPSNTGKSHLFNVVDSLLGKNKIPEKIKQEKTYSQSVLEISAGDDIHSFIRDINSNKSYYQKGEVYGWSDLDNLTMLANKHNSSESGRLGISNYLLNIMNCPYKKIRSNQKGKLTAFSFRYFSHQYMIGESNIFENKAYFLSNQQQQITAGKEAFLTILSGIDDSSLLNDEKLVSSEKIIGQITEIQRQIYQNDQVLERMPTSECKDMDIINSKIDSCKMSIRDFTSQIGSLELKRNDVYKKLKKINQNFNYSTEVLKRIELLKENYESDLKRIDFVDQSNYYFEQLENFSCPICGEETTELTDDVSNLVRIEKTNLTSKLSGLEMALKDAQSDVHKKKTDKLNHEKQISLIDRALEKEIQPILSKTMTEYESLIKRKNEYSGKQFLEKQNTSLSNRLEELDVQQKQIKDKGTNTDLKIKKINFEELARIVKSLLEEWKLFENVNIEFDSKTYDLIVDGDPKGSFGKGYRALLNSAYVIANFLYAQNRKLVHPGFVVIDSPLVAFSPKIEEENDISEEVKDLFYKSLARRFAKSQIIILENQTPNDESFTAFNHIQFTRNTKLGRYGLYPYLEK